MNEIKDQLVKLNGNIDSIANFDNSNISDGRYKLNMVKNEAEIREFELDDDDYYAISIATNVIHKLLSHSNIKSKQVVVLGNALYALERLPLQTEGVNCEFGVTYRQEIEEFNEMRYIDFTISEESFKISGGGSVYNQSVGGDSYSNPSWYIEIDGYKDRQAELFEIESSVEEYLNLGAKIVVDDNSDIIVNDYLDIECD